MAHTIPIRVRPENEAVSSPKGTLAGGLFAPDYADRKPPSTLLFESTNAETGDESELFRDLEA